MTSEQQIKNMFGKDNTYIYSVGQTNELKQVRIIFVVKVHVIDEWFCIGLSHSRYKACTDALLKMGGKRISGSGKYQKDKL